MATPRKGAPRTATTDPPRVSWWLCASDRFYEAAKGQEERLRLTKVNGKIARFYVPEGWDV